MIKHLALGSLVLLGSTLLVGCGVSGHLSATPTGNGNYNVSGTVHTSGVPTPSSPSTAISGPSNTVTISTSRSSNTKLATPSSHPTSTSTSNSSPSSLIRITNPSLANIRTAIDNGVIYGVNDPQTHDTIFLMANTTLTIMPTTLHHWPSQRFHVYAVLTNAENQLGGSTGTAWINFLSHKVHWLKIAPDVTIRVVASASHTNFNTVVRQAFQAIQGHTTAVIGGPTSLPAAHGGYLTAQTHASTTGWRIQLVETLHPYAVNSPLINGNHVVGGTAAWGTTLLPSIPVNDSQAVATANGLWNTRTVINLNASHQSTQVGTAQYGRPATLYPASGNQWPNTKLVFTEGEWTIELIGSNASSEEQAAYTIANTLHFQSLPPYPGLMIVDMTVPASSHAVSLAAATTTLDWVKGSTVFWVSASQASNNNPEQAIQLATSWTLWNK